MKQKWIFGVFSIAVMLAVIVGILLRYQHTSLERLQDLSEKTFEQFHSTADKDNDGIDDQVDILQGALDYCNTNPKYKSKYYDGGYPNDGYGVCTDVVAYAMKAAGYDLMELVEKDIREHSDEYGITKPDKNIDFRRVRNLQVFFRNYVDNLTTDVFDVDNWQGGDIVIFKNHIGIVSDGRNADGVPYVIHHNDSWQKSYEEDILESRNDIVGHYRWLPEEDSR